MHLSLWLPQLIPSVWTRRMDSHPSSQVSSGDGGWEGCSAPPPNPRLHHRYGQGLGTRTLSTCCQLCVTPTAIGAGKLTGLGRGGHGDAPWSPGLRQEPPIDFPKQKGHLGVLALSRQIKFSPLFILTNRSCSTGFPFPPRQNEGGGGSSLSLAPLPRRSSLPHSGAQSPEPPQLPAPAWP